ncbi:MAG: hypothetical protein ACOC5T_06330 [Elusimicrobiota bacterium]
MRKNKTIEKILCPMCNTAFLIEKTITSNSREVEKGKKHWACPECPHVFPKGYFKTFSNYDEYIAESEEEIGELDEIRKKELASKKIY